MDFVNEEKTIGRQTARERIKEYLENNGNGAHYRDISRALEGVNEGTLHSALKDMKRSGELVQYRVKGPYKLRQSKTGQTVSQETADSDSREIEKYMIGCSDAMKTLKADIMTAGYCGLPVVIVGETGSGKEIAAQCVHKISSRKDRPFVTVDCPALPNELVESELFGYAHGAFTGAAGSRKGLVMTADCGTLFLDEIQHLSMPSQAKLLRTIESQEVRPLGKDEVGKVDVRIVAASNEDLFGLVKEGKFREDLYYRLACIELRVPALRERKNDIPALAYYFIKKLSSREPLGDLIVGDPAIYKLCEHGWPGNVRELRNVIEYAAVLRKTGEIQPEDIRIKGDIRIKLDGKTDTDHLEELYKSFVSGKLDFVSSTIRLYETGRLTREDIQTILSRTGDINKSLSSTLRMLGVTSRGDYQRANRFLHRIGLYNGRGEI